MHCASRDRCSTQAGADLHQAAWVSGRDEFCVRCFDVAQFRREDGVRGIGLDEIVDSGRSAAVLGALKRNELELGNRSQDCKRWIGDALCVKEVTRSIVRDLRTHRAATFWSRSNEQLAHVAYTGGESRRSLAPLVIFGEKMCIFFHHRATAS